MLKRGNRAVCVVAGLLCASGAAMPRMATAEPVQMVIASLSHAGTSPKSAIPGVIPGGAGAQADPRFNNLNVRSYHSPTGSTWITGASTNLTPNPNVVIMGSGLTITGNALLARDGMTTGEVLNVNSLQSIPRVNASGQWAMASGNTPGAGSIIKWDGTNLVTVFKANDALPGGVGICGGTFTSANIANDGSVTFGAVADVAGSQSSGPYGAYTTLGLGSGLVVPGSSVPNDQPGGAMVPWTRINNLVGISQDATGAHWLAHGVLAGFATVVVDNSVKIMENNPLPGFASTVSGVTEAYMETNGDWYAWGQNADGVRWALRNGVVIAQSGTPIFAGASENWKPATSFIFVRGNPNGNYVVTGTTDSTDTTRNQVIVLNGQRVLARTSDQVDLNADGGFAGSLYINNPLQDKGTYCADGYYYFASRMKNGAAGTALTTSASFVRVRACPSDYNGTGTLEVQDIFDYLNGWFAGNLRADFNRNGTLAVQDIFDYLNAWFAGC
jgi:hypothetical protein